MITSIVLGVFVFLSMAGLDFAAACVMRAVTEKRPGAAAFWSVAQWGAGTLALVAYLETGAWVLPIEAAGLAAGMWVAVRRMRAP